MFFVKNCLPWAFLGFLLVAFGQSAWIGWLGPLAAAGGYALFWMTLPSFSSSLKQGLAGTIWFAAVQAVQLSWLTSTEFHGYYILGVYFGYILCLGLQFGLLSALVGTLKKISIAQGAAIASVWALLEWSRYHFLCGFSWNPVGMALTTYPWPTQLAAVIGILGLSFWVMWTNLLGLRAWRSLGAWSLALWGAVVLFPYLFGAIHYSYHRHLQSKQSPLGLAAIVQTGLLPSEQVPLGDRREEFISPWEQWSRIFFLLRERVAKNDLNTKLIVMPESTVPFQAAQMVYQFRYAKALLQEEFGKDIFFAMPPLQFPYAEKRSMDGGDEEFFVSNAFFSQFLANYFQSELIIGLNDEDRQTRANFSAALHFLPNQSGYDRYEKQILVPLAEYLPFRWCSKFVASYGISDFYTHGKESKVFLGHRPVSISICYEETFPNLIRKGKQLGAELFINLTNDNWFPRSRLAKQHFDHGRLRAVENGVPLIRACNSGITAMIDAQGDTVAQLVEGRGVLLAEMPTYHHSTIYTVVGDSFIVSASFLICLLYSFNFLLKRRSMLLN